MNATTSQFTYNAETKTFATEASDFGPIGTPLFHQIYQDACDLGICLTSHQSGKEAIYFLDHVETNGEDLIFWQLKPTTETVRRIPSTLNTVVVIFND